jgi:hypothetical protein
MWEANYEKLKPVGKEIGMRGRPRCSNLNRYPLEVITLEGSVDGASWQTLLSESGYAAEDGVKAYRSSTGVSLSVIPAPARPHAFGIRG